MGEIAKQLHEIAFALGIVAKMIIWSAIIRAAFNK